MHKSSNLTIYYLIIAFILVSTIFAFYIHIQDVFGGDNGFGFPTLNAVYQSIYVWQQYNYSGLSSILGSIPADIFYAILSFAYLFGIKFGFDISYAVYFLIGLAGMFFLVYELTNYYPKAIRILAASTSSIIFLTNKFIQYNTLNSPISIFLPLVILFGYKLFYVEHNQKNLKITLFGFVVSITFFLAFGSISHIFLNSVVLAILAILTLVFSGRKYIVRNARYMLITFVLVVAINASWLFTTYTFVSTPTGQAFFGNGSKGTLNAVAIPFMQSFFLFWPASNGLGLFGVLSMLSMFVVALFSYTYIKRKNGGYAVAASLLILYLIMVGMASTINLPFGALFSKMLNILPQLLTLRYPVSATHYIFTFLIATLFGIGVAVISLKLDKKSKYVRLSFFAFIIFILSIYSYSAALVGQGLPSQNLPIPTYVFQISNYINSQTGIFSVATLPMESGWQVTNWYVSENIYSSLLHHPVYTGSYTALNEIFFPVSTSEYYKNVGLIVDSQNTRNLSLSNGFGVFGIKYIIVQGDALNYSICKYCYISPFKFSNIYLALNASKNIKFVVRYGNSSIYKNGNYVPLVYPSNIKNIGNASTENIFSEIKNKDFNIQNTSVYSTSIGSFYKDNKTINVMQVKNFKSPNITFIDNTPAKIIVYVSNATTPFYLVFRETYDPHWAAFYSNGVEINPEDHIAVNGFANAWYMNKTGNYTVTLYYTPQTDAWIAWGISFAALFITIGIGVYGWKETRKERNSHR